MNKIKLLKELELRQRLNNKISEFISVEIEKKKEEMLSQINISEEDIIYFITLIEELGRLKIKYREIATINKTEIDFIAKNPKDEIMDKTTV